MADEDAGAQGGSPPTEARSPRKRGLWWAVLGVLLAVVALAAGIVLASGDGDDDESKVAGADKRVTTTAIPTISTPVTAPNASSGAGGGASGGGTKTTSPATNTATTAPSTATTAPATATAPPPNFVAFTSAVATPAVVHCEIGQPINVTISWTTRNATEVRLYTPTGQLMDPNGSVKFPPFNCSATLPARLDLFAKGPTGTASTTVYWSYEITNPPANAK